MNSSWKSARQEQEYEVYLSFFANDKRKIYSLVLAASRQLRDHDGNCLRWLLRALKLIPFLIGSGTSNYSLKGEH